MKISLRTPRLLLKILFSSVVLLAASNISLQASTVVDSYIQGGLTDQSGAWKRINGAFGTVSGLPSAAGGQAYYHGLATGAATDRGVWRYFDGVVIEAGTYTVSFYVGGLPEADFPAAFGNIRLLADTDGNPDSWSYNERITQNVTVTPAANSAPETGQWSVWTYTFIITEDTLTAAGNRVIGSTLGFTLLNNMSAGQQGQSVGFAFDHLKIDYAAPVPEASTTILFVSAVAGAVVFLRRRRKA